MLSEKSQWTEFEDSRFWCEIWFKIWDLAWIFESPVKKISDFRVRFDLWFAHHCVGAHIPMRFGLQLSACIAWHCQYLRLKQFCCINHSIISLAKLTIVPSRYLCFSIRLGSFWLKWLLILVLLVCGIKQRPYGVYFDRRLATAWIHCAGSATYEVTDPEP